MNKTPFFSIAELKQPVNQWLCIAFLGVFCFWTVLYYLTQKTQIIGESYAADTAYYIKNAGQTEIKSASERAKSPATLSPSQDSTAPPAY